MSRLLFSGFESKSASAEGFSSISATAPTFDTAVPRGGAVCMRVNATTASIGIGYSGVVNRTYFARFWFRLHANPAATRTFAAFRSSDVSGTVRTANLKIDSSGRVIGADGTVSSALALDTWHKIEISVIANGTTHTWEVRLNGTTVGASASAADSSTPAAFRIGNLDGTTFPDCYYDDFALNDDQGASNNTWCGDGKIIILKPTADSAVGADWKLGDATSPGGAAWDSVNNVPPVGVADAGASAGAQIRDVVGSQTAPAADADFTMESYTAAGMAGTDVVLCTQARAAVGTAGVTNRSMAVKLASNPADSAETTGGSGSTPVGTYPAGWNNNGVLKGELQSFPTVTLGTAPVARVGKRTTSSTMMGCCSVLIHVEYVPGPQTVSPSSIASSEAWGSPTVSLKVFPSSIASSEAWGSPTLTPGGVTVSPSSIASSEAWGTPALSLGVGVFPSSILSSEAWGSPTISLKASPSSIPSSEAWGTPTLSLGIVTSSIASSEAWGSPTVTREELELFLPTSLAEEFHGAFGFLDLELPVRITPTFKSRWESGQHIGAAKPELRVEIRQGRFNRRYDYWFDEGLPIDAVIGESNPLKPWQAYWEPTTEYVEIPGVLSIETGNNFEQRGIEALVLTLDNVAYIEQEDDDGNWHKVRRGWLSPLRGYVADGRTPLTDEGGDEVATNEWFQVLNRNYQITVHEGYGDQEVKTFTGLIDDVDTTSRPDKIVINTRSFGQVLADEEFFGWNIDKDLRDPIIFIDKDEADNIRKVGTSPSASSDDGSHTADNVSDGDSDTFWRSQAHDIWTVTEWVQIQVPEGRYSDFLLGAKYDALDVYVSVMPTALANGNNPTLDGGDLAPDEWVDLSIGSVPGSFGGVPYIRLFNNSGTDTAEHDLNATAGEGGLFPGGEFEMGSGSVIRLSFRNLWDAGGANFYAGVRSFYGRKRTLVPDAVAQKWIRVGDVSDIVKVVLRWAGFKEWEVESAGVKLGKRLLVNRQMKYMDLIDKVKDMLGYVFFVSYPTDDERSIGIPVFRRPQIIDDVAPPAITVTDELLLSAVDIKQTDEPLAYIIRVRGRENQKSGVGLGGDSTKRIQYEYRPPWSGLGLAGILKHVIQTNPLYSRADDVKFAAWFIAIQEALESIAVGIEIPAYPGVDLDDMVEMMDLGTGLTTRLSLRERRSTHVVGEQPKWTMSLSGAVVDVPDLQEILDLVRAATRDGN